MLAFIYIRVCVTEVGDRILRPTTQKEQFQIAYVSAMAAHAGLTTNHPMVDDDSVDIQINGRNFPGRVRRPIIQVQLKCTSQDLIREELIKFPLKKKNYDDLRDSHVVVPRYLAILVVPEDNNIWIEHLDGHMLLRNECYWMSIKDMPDTPNDTSVTVSVPLAQRLTSGQLFNLMMQASQAGTT